MQALRENGSVTNTTVLELCNENISMSSFWALLEGSLPSARGHLEPGDPFPLSPAVSSSEDGTFPWPVLADMNNCTNK